MNGVQRLVLVLAGTGILAVSGMTTVSAAMNTDNAAKSSATMATVTTVEITDDATTATLSEAVDNDDPALDVPA